MLDEKFASEFFCLYFIGSLHAITEHGEVVSKGVLAVNLLPDGLTGCNSQNYYKFIKIFINIPKNLGNETLTREK